MSESLLLTWNWKRYKKKTRFSTTRNSLNKCWMIFLCFAISVHSQIAIFAIVMRGTSFDRLRCKPIWEYGIFFMIWAPMKNDQMFPVCRNWFKLVLCDHALMEACSNWFIWNCPAVRMSKGNSKVLEGFFVASESWWVRSKVRRLRVAVLSLEDSWGRSVFRAKFSGDLKLFF